MEYSGSVGGIIPMSCLLHPLYHIPIVLTPLCRLAPTEAQAKPDAGSSTPVGPHLPLCLLTLGYLLTVLLVRKQILMEALCKVICVASLIIQILDKPPLSADRFLSFSKTSHTHPYVAPSHNRTLLD